MLNSKNKLELVLSAPSHSSTVHSHRVTAEFIQIQRLLVTLDTWGGGGGSIITTFHFSFKKKASIMTKWFNFSFKKKKVKIYFRGFLLGGWWVVPFPKTVINLTRTSEKLNCKGEPYRFIDQQEPLVQTYRQIDCYYYIMIQHFFPPGPDSANQYNMVQSEHNILHQIKKTCKNKKKGRQENSPLPPLPLSSQHPPCSAPYDNTATNEQKISIFQRVLLL